MNKIYTHVIATGVFEENSNKNESSLYRSRFTEFMKETKKACLPHYYERFKYCLKNALDTEIDDGFVCTWQDIEDSMIQAIGKENKVNRLHAFNKIKSSDFHSKPLELLIADIDNKVDAALGNSTSYHPDTKGRMLSPYTHFSYLKYKFILGVTETLAGAFSQVKDYIEQEISDMHDDYKKLVDIQTFQQKLVSEFNTRNLIRIFRSKDVPQPKKQPNDNNSEVKDKKERKGLLKRMGTR